MLLGILTFINIREGVTNFLGWWMVMRTIPAAIKSIEESLESLPTNSEIADLPEAIRLEIQELPARAKKWVP